MIFNNHKKHFDLYKIILFREHDKDLGDTADKFVIFLMMVRIFLLQSWPTIRSLDKPPIRYILTTILIFSLLLATCYNSGLASSMTVPR